MNKQIFLKKFSRTLRWRLPKSEADEILADYDEIFSHHLEAYDDISIPQLGNPVQAAKRLSPAKVYYPWLAVFGMMTCCLLLSEILLLHASFPRYPDILMYILLLLGLAISIVWFRPKHRAHQKTPVPKHLFYMLLVLVVMAMVPVAMLAYLRMNLFQHLPFSLHGNIAGLVLQLSGTMAAALGLYGLIKARLSDSRWRCLYVMGLSVLASCVLELALLHSMSLDISSADWWIPYATNLGIVWGIGLIGSGVSLC